jgi:hypothetical protein
MGEPRKRDDDQVDQLIVLCLPFKDAQPHLVDGCEHAGKLTRNSMI